MTGKDILWALLAGLHVCSACSCSRPPPPPATDPADRRVDDERPGEDDSPSRWRRSIELLRNQTADDAEFAERGLLLAALLSKTSGRGPALDSADEAALVQRANAPSLRGTSEFSVFSVARYRRGVQKLLNLEAEKIRGGFEYKAKQRPEVLALLKAKSDGSIRFFCSAVAVSSRRLVTAKHCKEKAGDAAVWVGKSVDAYRTPHHVVARWLPREDHSGSIDVAFAELATDEFAQFARCASTVEIDGYTQNSVLVAGYGSNEADGTGGEGIRRGIFLGLASVDCREPEFATRFGCQPGIELLAGIDDLDRDSCRGDSGGPLFLRGPGTYTLAGITSRGTRDANQVCGDGGIYVRIDASEELNRLACGR